MTQHSKMFNASNLGLYIFRLGLVTVLALFGSVNVQAADTDESGVQLSMIDQPGARSEAKEELKALEEEYINDVISALNRKHTGPDFSNDDVYADHLVLIMEGKTQHGKPNFADEDVYVDHLVEILMK